jgi:hypothetical protein
LPCESRLTSASCDIVMTSRNAHTRNAHAHYLQRRDHSRQRALCGAEFVLLLRQLLLGLRQLGLDDADHDRTHVAEYRDHTNLQRARVLEFVSQ